MPEYQPPGAQSDDVLNIRREQAADAAAHQREELLDELAERFEQLNERLDDSGGVSPVSQKALRPILTAIEQLLDHEGKL